jgi:hypothetical protein
MKVQTTAYRVLWIVGILPLALFASPASANSDYIVVLDEECVSTGFVNVAGVSQSKELSERIMKVTVADQVSVNNLKQDKCLESVEPDQEVKLASYNDSFYNVQWYLHNTGQTVLGKQGISDMDIDFPEAVGKLSTKEVKVAVVDTGVDEISELSGRVLPGYNFVDNNSSPDDQNGHGTFIANLIAARSNNSSGVVGLYEPARILPVKVLSSFGTGLLSDLIEGIDYAIDQDADVINLSLVTGYTTALNTVIEKAYNNDVIVVAASGNDGVNIDGGNRKSPIGNDGSNDWVIGVGAHDNRGNRSSFSNFGNDVDILAPGEGIIGVTIGGSAQYQNGTSIATAVVSGIVAAWEGYYGDITPSQAHSLIDNNDVNGRINLNSALKITDYPDGTLVKSATSGVFLIENGLKHPITTPEIFLSYNWRWSEIVTISQGDLNAIKNGPELKMRDGMLVADSGSVYLVEYGKKRPIASAQVFLGLGLSWNNVTYPGDANLNKLPTGTLINSTQDLTNGMVVTAPGYPVYLIDGGKRRPILDPYIYTSYFRWEELQNVSGAVISKYPVGSTVLPQEGEIIADNGSVYMVSNGRRRPFVSGSVYTGRGFRWDTVIFPSPFVHSLLPKGELIR